jgi:hypothetical protein
MLCVVMLSVPVFCYVKCHNTECGFFVCRIFIVMLSVIMLSDGMPGNCFVTQSVIMLSVGKLCSIFSLC